MGIFFSAIFCLLCLVVFNRGLRWLQPQKALTQVELLTIYAMLAMAITVSGHDFSQTIFCTVASSHWFATPENEFRELFIRHLPGW